MAKQLRAGAAASNTSPWLGVSLNGSMNDKTAEHIHDELHARCLVLDNGQEQIGLVVCDMCMIPRRVLDAAKEQVQAHAGLPLDRIAISATHTHTAPTVGAVFQSEPDEEYAAFLALRVADGLRRALNNLAPARVAWGTADAPEHVHNRRWKVKEGFDLTNPFGGTDQVKMNPPPGSDVLLEPSGPTDPQVTFLSVQHADGRPLALLANYSLHYVGGCGPGHVSADYYGEFCRRMALAVGARTTDDPPFVAGMFNGTSGNINNTNFREGRAARAPYEQIRLVAQSVADKIKAALDGISYRDWVELDMRESLLTLARRMPSRDEVARAKYILSRGEGLPLRSREEIYARETVLLADMSPEIETILQAIRIGELGIATSPCETFVETGLAIREASPFEQQMTISLANDYAGYLPTVEHHALGGYETWRARSSFLEVEAEPKIRQRLLEMTKELARG